MSLPPRNLSVSSNSWFCDNRLTHSVSAVETLRLCVEVCSGAWSWEGPEGPPGLGEHLSWLLRVARGALKRPHNMLGEVPYVRGPPGDYLFSPWGWQLLGVSG